MIENDVYLFEALSARLRACATLHPSAQAETLVNGALLIASAAALRRYAAFIWWLHELPASRFAQIAWRFGEAKPLHRLAPKQRQRIDGSLVRNGSHKHCKQLLDIGMKCALQPFPLFG